MYNTELFASLWAFLASFGIFITLIVVFTIIVRWKMFTKAGKPGWASIVPVYSDIVLLDIIGYNWYYIFVGCLSIVPVVGSLAVLLFEISKNIKLAKSFGKEVGFGIGLTFLNPIFTAIIAFDSSITYKGKEINGNIDFNDLF